MPKTIALTVILLVSSGRVYGVDLTNLICGQPQMQEAELTKACKDNTISASIICQGNEGKAWCKGASLDINDTSVLRVSIGFRNKHVPLKGVVLYDSSSTGYITIWIDKTCRILDKKVEFSNTSAQILQSIGEIFGKRIEDSIPNKVPGC